MSCIRRNFINVSNVENEKEKGAVLLMEDNVYVSNRHRLFLVVWGENVLNEMNFIIMDVKDVFLASRIYEETCKRVILIAI